LNEVIHTVKAIIRGWANYFRTGNSNRTFCKVRDSIEKKVRNSIYICLIPIYVSFDSPVEKKLYRSTLNCRIIVFKGGSKSVSLCVRH
jgi:hypothetical protein